MAGAAAFGSTGCQQSRIDPAKGRAILQIPRDGKNWTVRFSDVFSKNYFCASARDDARSQDLFNLIPFCRTFVISGGGGAQGEGIGGL